MLFIRHFVKVANGIRTIREFLKRHQWDAYETSTSGKNKAFKVVLWKPVKHPSFWTSISFVY